MEMNRRPIASSYFVDPYEDLPYVIELRYSYDEPMTTLRFDNRPEWSDEVQRLGIGVNGADL